MEDLAKIEKEMQRCAKKSIRPRRYTLPRAEAIAYMQGRQEPYKVELIEDLPRMRCCPSTRWATSPTCAWARTCQSELYQGV